MRFVSVSCGTDSAKHPKSRPVETVTDAYRFVQAYDPEDLNYVYVNIHLVKEDLSPEAFSALVKHVLQIHKAPDWGGRSTTNDTQPDQRLPKKRWNPVPGSRLWCTLAIIASLALSGSPLAHAANNQAIHTPPETAESIQPTKPQLPVTPDASTPSRTQPTEHGSQSPAPPSHGISDWMLEAGITSGLTLVLQIITCVSLGFCVFTPQ